jgi:tetratricopeptide (TPR) repeat protein
MWLALVLALAPPDAPRSIVLLPESGAREVVFAATTGTPSSLVDARKMGEQLRYEEAVVEYQRYLATPDRPTAERAQALLELGFTYLVLGDQQNAESRALEALELSPKIALPSNAPAKQVDFVSKMRKAFLARPKLELESGEAEQPWIVKVKKRDPENKVSRLLLRHALTATGPFYATEMTCEEEVCTGAIPPPKDVSSFTAWYFVEALDDTQITQARIASPDAPLQLAIVDQKPWYTSPFVWGGLGAALVGAATVVFLLSPQPPK